MFNIKRNNYIQNPKKNTVQTPLNVVEAMINLYKNNYKNFNPKLILEPNFGDGNILRALLNTFKDSKIIANELNTDLYNIAKEEFNHASNLELHNKDFLDLDIGLVDTIFCNPPFSTPTVRALWAKFLKRSFEMLTNDGKMIFILPCHWCFNTDLYARNYGKYFSKYNFVPITVGVFYQKSIACNLVCIDKCNKDSTYEKVLNEINSKGEII